VSDIEGGKLIQLSEIEQAEADQLKQTIDEQFALIQSHGRVLETTFVELAKSLKRVRETRYWIPWGYHSWTSYISSLHHKVARSTLFQYIGVVEALSGQISDEDLTKMGIKKALELKRVLSAKPDALLTDKVREVALDPDKTTDDLRVTVAEEQGVTPEYPGTWFDLGTVYVTADEKRLIQRAFSIAVRVDPPLSTAVPEWALKKSIIERLCQEFLSTYEAITENPQ
jgi:hypothetical protein